MPQPTIYDEMIKNDKLRRYVKMEDTIMDITDAICEQMETTGITKKNIADMTGVTIQTINNFLSGRTRPRIDIVIMILNALNMDLKLVGC